jgi:hypothetical protein
LAVSGDPAKAMSVVGYYLRDLAPNNKNCLTIGDFTGDYLLRSDERLVFDALVKSSVNILLG